MENHQCRFCSKRRQCLYASSEQLQSGGNLIHTMNKSLYYQHGQSQNYFYSRAINHILRQEKRTIYGKFEDQKILDKEEEYLKQFFYMPNCQLQLKQLVRYYKFSIDHPMLYFVDLEAIILKYVSGRSQIEYQWAMNQIERETLRDGASPKKSKKKKREISNKIETSCFLKDLINDSQKSTTILQLLKNVDADSAVEKDWQKQFAQSLVEQDLTKALQFSTFIQQKEFQKPKDFVMKDSSTSQKAVYFGNLKKSLNLQLGTPRKASNIIQNNFNSVCSTHANSGSSNFNNLQNNQNLNMPTQNSVMNKLVATNLHFFNHNPSHQSISNSTQSQNFITKTHIVNNSNSNIYKPQATMRIQPLRLMEVPKLKIKLSHQEPKSERKHDKLRQTRADCLTQRIKTQVDECSSARSSVNVKPIVIKRRQNFYH